MFLREIPNPTLSQKILGVLVLWSPKNLNVFRWTRGEIHDRDIHSPTPYLRAPELHCFWDNLLSSFQGQEFASLRHVKLITGKHQSKNNILGVVSGKTTSATPKNDCIFEGFVFSCRLLKSKDAKKEIPPSLVSTPAHTVITKKAQICINDAQSADFDQKKMLPKKQVSHCNRETI